MNKCWICGSEATAKCDCCKEYMCHGHRIVFTNECIRAKLDVCGECVKYAIESVRPPEKGA